MWAAKGHPGDTASGKSTVHRSAGGHNQPPRPTRYPRSPARHFFPPCFRRGVCASVPPSPPTPPMFLPHPPDTPLLKGAAIQAAFKGDCEYWNIDQLTYSLAPSPPPPPPPPLRSSRKRESPTFHTTRLALMRLLVVDASTLVPRFLRPFTPMCSRASRRWSFSEDHTNSCRRRPRRSTRRFGRIPTLPVLPATV